MAVSGSSTEGSFADDSVGAIAPDSDSGGWTYVFDSEALQQRTILEKRVNDTDVIIWRDDDLRVHVQSVRCPHMGVNLSQGVNLGHAIMCPMHGWRFGSDGKCLGGRAMLPTWRARELAGRIEVNVNRRVDSAPIAPAVAASAEKVDSPITTDLEN